MGNYTNIQNEVRATIYENTGGAVTGARLQELVLNIINVLGNESCFKGVLSNANKPTAAVDGKQWYVGYSASGTTTVDLTSVGLGTLSITPSDIYIVYSTSVGWAAINIASGIGGRITSLNTTLTNMGATVGRIASSQKDCVRAIVDIAMDGEHSVVTDTENIKYMAVDGVPIDVTDTIAFVAGVHSVDFIFEDASLSMSNSAIPKDCFKGITVLKAAILPSYILSIEDGAFANSTIESVHCFSALPPALGDGVFEDTAIFDGSDFSDVFVPKGSETAYEAAWGSGTYRELTIF